MEIHTSFELFLSESEDGLQAKTTVAAEVKAEGNADAVIGDEEFN